MGAVQAVDDALHGLDGGHGSQARGGRCTGETARMIRPARPDDVPTMLAFVHELAAYEREPDAVTATEDDLRAALFGPEPKVWAHVARRRR